MALVMSPSPASEQLGSLLDAASLALVALGEPAQQPSHDVLRGTGVVAAQLIVDFLPTEDEHLVAVVVVFGLIGLALGQVHGISPYIVQRFGIACRLSVSHNQNSLRIVV